MSKQKNKPEIDTTPNCTAVQFPGLPKKVIATTIKEMAIQQYRKDYKLSHLRPDNQFKTELVFELPREKR